MFDRDLKVALCCIALFGNVSLVTFFTSERSNRATNYIDDRHSTRSDLATAIPVDLKQPEEIALAIESLVKDDLLRQKTIENGLKRANRWTAKDYIQVSVNRRVSRRGRAAIPGLLIN